MDVNTLQRRSKLGQHMGGRVMGGLTRKRAHSPESPDIDKTFCSWRSLSGIPRGHREEACPEAIPSSSSSSSWRGWISENSIIVSRETRESTSRNTSRRRGFPGPSSTPAEEDPFPGTGPERSTQGTRESQTQYSVTRVKVRERGRLEVAERNPKLKTEVVSSASFPPRVYCFGYRSLLHSRIKILQLHGGARENGWV